MRGNMDFIEKYNEFTKACDEHLIRDARNCRLFRTYLVGIDNSDPSVIAYAIRVPGATRGSIYVYKNTNIIKSIYFDKYTAFGERIGCYEESIISATNKWIGKEFK